MEADEESDPSPRNAFPPTTSAAPLASWNPALRRDSDAPTDEDDDFFNRYPGPTPKKGQQYFDQDPAEELERRQSISVQHVIDVREDDASPEDLQELPSSHVEVAGPVTHHAHDEEGEEVPEHDEEAAILAPGESVAEQAMALDEQMPDLGSVEATQEVGDGVEQVDHAAGEVEEGVSSPAAHYEHQGEVTEMEEAIEASAQASLIADEAPLPTPGHESRQPTWTRPSRESTLGFDGAPAPRQPQLKSTFAKPEMARSFTTNFSDSPIEPRQQQEQAQEQDQSIPNDWPSMGDDKTFGELLDNQQPISTERAGLEEVAAQESEQVAAPDDDLLLEELGEVKEEDLAAAWGAAIDDDELLETTPTSFDPSNAFGDDDDGFLEDEPTIPTPVQAQQSLPKQRTAPTYRPPNAHQPSQQRPQYNIPSPQMFDQASHGRSAGTPSTGLFDLYDQPGSMHQQPQRPAMPQQTQSFADKSKGGYQSPYDLPMDVVMPKRRPQQQQQARSQVGSQAPVPPPRTSSFGSQAGQVLASRSTTFGSQAAPLPPPGRRREGSVSSLSPPLSSHSGGSAGPVPPVVGSVSAKNTPKTGSGFFEDLPMTAKPRARPAGAYTPQLGGMPTPPLTSGAVPPPQHHPSRGAPVLPHQVPLDRAGPASFAPQQPVVGGFGELRQPERMPLLPDQPDPRSTAQPAQGPPSNTRYSPSSQQGVQPSAPAVLPATQNRFSPAPLPSHNAPAPAASRYSPAPTAQPAQRPAPNRYVSASANAPPPHANPFAPRTSSPLAAHTEKPHPPLPPEASRSLPPSSPPKANGYRNASMSSESRPSTTSSKYAPSERRGTDPPTDFGPPLPRPRTQSPDATMKGPKMMRPSSSAGMPVAPQLAVRSTGPVLPHRRQFSRELTFAAPLDERSQDPLERWKGYPIFKWSAGGTVLSSFPKQIPFYAAGQGIPSVKCAPGAISVQDASLFMPMDEWDSRFPGPLKARSKSQKKDLVAWLAGKIEDLERRTESAMLDFGMEVEMRKRVEEKMVLWKIVSIFVEHDGVVEGNPRIEEEVRRVLLPNLAQMAQVADLQSPLASSGLQPDGVDKQVLFQLRQALLEGQRERAVWLAEEKKLWGHAMLVASTMGPETWKQIVRAFVRSQVKTVGSDARSMAALYQVFAGNSEECVDELVPPSARAGFRMISNVDGSVSGNPLEGLDQWRETLGLVTSNRTASDGPSLVSLGKLLASYGRVEAAHTCFLFARQFAKHSGADDVEANFVLLGANHQATDESFGDDLDSILLTEIYEYASSLSAPSTAVSYIPHLQAFKLMHAQELAAYGLKTMASTYTDHIASAYQSTTRPSPYYHPTFTQSVTDFQAFLSQTPHDGKSSFFSKPAMNKVSSGAASWFTKFVAGEDDQVSVGSGPGGAGSDDMAGPFGRVNGESPSISRSASTADLYNPGMGGMPIPGMSPAVGTPSSFAPSSAPSRYAPSSSLGGGSKYAPGQFHAGLGIPAAEPQRPSSSRYAPAPSNLGVPRPDASRRSSDHSVGYAPSSRRGSAQDTSSQGSYEPRPILADEGSAYSYSPPVHSPLVHAQAAPAVQEAEAMDPFAAPNGVPEQLHDDEEGGMDAEIGSGYLPPTDGYEPPSYSYQPYEPEPDSPEEPRSRRTFGDDDDDVQTAKLAASSKKSQADREVDDAFRKAAEADAARGKAGADPKKGWLTGWFGGKKDPNLAPGPIRAKLGEDNSFYYDEKLKKWVNKKGGSEAATPAAATPPPPRGPASRIASAAAMGPPSGPPSRASSNPVLSGIGSRPPTSGSGPAFSGPPSGPPSRTGTPASQPSSEPGFAPPAGLNGDAPLPPPSAPPLRPGSSLSTASSIDDLLAGPPGSRKGGTVKGKKKGGRYVDVMAK